MPDRDRRLQPQVREHHSQLWRIGLVRDAAARPSGSVPRLPTCIEDGVVEVVLMEDDNTHTFAT